MRRNPATIFGDEQAVSAVVGVVMLVGITVILVTVVAATALGIGSELEDPGPQVSFEWDYDSTDDTLTIVHQGGDTFDAEQVKVKWGGKNIDWAAHSSGSTVSTGSSVTIGDIDVDGSGTVEQDEKIGEDEKVFVVNQPNPEDATLIGRWGGVDEN